MSKAGPGEAFGDKHAPELRGRDFLFGFVAVSHGFIITSIFPVLYEAIRRMWKAQAALPDVPTGILDGFALYLGRRNLAVMGPYIDKLFLALSLSVVWAAYYYIVARARSLSTNSYPWKYFGIDLGQTFVLYCAAQSLKNYDEKSMPALDTAWIGLLLAVGVFLLRSIICAIDVPDPNLGGGGREAQFRKVRTQKWLRALVVLINTTLIVSVLLALRVAYDVGQFSLAVESAFGATIVGLACVAVWTVFVMWRLLLRSDDSSFKWVWRGERVWLIVQASIVIAMLAWIALFSGSIYGLVLEIRQWAPLSLVCLVTLVVGIGRTAWIQRDPVQYQAVGMSTPVSDKVSSAEILRQFYDVSLRAWDVEIEWSLVRSDLPRGLTAVSWPPAKGGPERLRSVMAGIVALRSEELFDATGEPKILGAGAECGPAVVQTGVFPSIPGETTQRGWLGAVALLAEAGKQPIGVLVAIPGPSHTWILSRGDFHETVVWSAQVLAQLHSWNGLRD